VYDHLLLPLAWVVDGGFWRTFGICLLICPILPQLIGMIGASYWPPLNPLRNQFWAYFPGNPCLALFIALTSTTYDGGDFAINPVANWGALIVMLMAYLALGQMDKQVYKPGQLRSANKRYHNLLYFWYGYLAVVCALEMFSSDVSFTEKVWITVPGALWVACLLVDSFFTSKELLEQKCGHAHADDVPIWAARGLRHWTPRGYALAA
jgi:hypothetical protein